MVVGMNTVHELRLKTTDSEKITINLGYVDLGHIDLMVQDGFYSNRTDFDPCDRAAPTQPLR